MSNYDDKRNDIRPLYTRAFSCECVMNWIVIKVGFTIHANQSNVSQVKSLFFALKLCGKNLNRVDFG